jgi:peptide/nickel transport system permease protein
MLTKDSAREANANAMIRLLAGLRWFRRTFRSNPTMMVGLSVVCFMVIIAIIAPLITTYEPRGLNPYDRLLGPSSAHWFGTDDLGRDVYTRTVYGSRISLQAGFAVAVLTLSIGAIIGLISGYYRQVDMVLMRLMDAFLAIPTLLLAIALMALMGASMKNVIICLCVVMTPYAARVCRASVLSLREELYVTAARALGVPDWRILLLHIFPGTVAPLMIQATYTLAVAILVEASLSFLGAGTPLDVPSWGNVIAQGRPYMQIAAWVALFPGIALFLTVLAINLAGDGLRDLLDPKLSNMRAGKK